MENDKYIANFLNTKIEERLRIMKSIFVALAALGSLADAAVEIRNSAYTNCDDTSAAACANLVATTDTYTDFTETLVLLEMAKLCVKANEGKADCVAGVGADVTVSGENVCENAAGFYMALDVGELEVSPYLVLNEPVPTENAGSVITGRYMTSAPDNTVCAGNVGDQGQFSISEDGATVTAPEPALAVYIPQTPVQTKVTMKFSKDFSSKNEATADEKDAKPMLPATAVIFASILTAAAF